MGLVTRARGHLTMLSGGGTRPGCLWAQGKYGLYTFYNVRPLLSFISVIFHHILLYHRRHFNWRRHIVPTCLALLDPCSHSPVPIFHSLQSRARSWQSVDLGPPIKFRPKLLKYSFTVLKNWIFSFNAISNFHFKSFIKNFVYLFGGMRTVRGQFRLESNCQNALFCTPQLPSAWPALAETLVQKDLLCKLPSLLWRAIIK